MKRSGIVVNLPGDRTELWQVGGFYDDSFPNSTSRRSRVTADVSPAIQAQNMMHIWYFTAYDTD